MSRSMRLPRWLHEVVRVLVILSVAVSPVSGLLRPSIVETAAGDLDTSFDINGKVTTDLGDTDRSLAMILQPEGKVVVDG